MLMYDVMRRASLSKIDPRRQQEMADSRMVQEDQRAMANLPTQAIHREYNQNRFNFSPLRDDEVGR